MKVAIITLHRVYNYGSALQAYATQRVFEKQDCDVQIIDYITEQRTKRQMLFGVSSKAPANRLKRGLYYAARLVTVLLKEMTFGSFVRKNLHLTPKYITAADLTLDPPRANVYVTGSDQTWNSDYNHGVDRGFFLDFVPEKAKRIAFVASFGKNELDMGEVEITKRYLARYSAISVRENTAVELLTKLGITGAVQLIDPTLQIEKDEWVKLASKRLVREPYLILMLLYNEDNHATEYARQIADARGLKLVKISWELTRPPMVDQLFTHRSPENFLSLFYYADFVVTNSFHGLAFSINLEKQFIVVPRNEYNSRIESLLALTGLRQRMITSPDELQRYTDTIDYNCVGPILEHERNRAEDFLRTNLTT